MSASPRHGCLSLLPKQVVVVLEIIRRDEFAELLVLAAGGPHQVFHADGCVVGGGQEGGGQGDVADVAAGEFELAGQEREVDVGGEGGFGGDGAAPDGQALG